MESVVRKLTAIDGVGTPTAPFFVPMLRIATRNGLPHSIASGRLGIRSPFRILVFDNAHEAPGTRGCYGRL
jgi:hypothetical protein